MHSDMYESGSMSKACPFAHMTCDCAHICPTILSGQWSCECPKVKLNKISWDTRNQCSCAGSQESGAVYLSWAAEAERNGTPGKRMAERRRKGLALHPASLSSSIRGAMFIYLQRWPSAEFQRIRPQCGLLWRLGLRCKLMVTIPGP